VEQCIEENNKKNVPKKALTLCDNCENDPKPAKFWCEICSVNYCGDCDALAHALKATKTHLRITTREKSIQPSLSKCSRHNEEMKFFCKECQTSLCSLCVVETHQGHKTITVHMLADEKRNELKVCIKAFQNLQILDQLESDLRKSKEKNLLELTRLETKIGKLKDKITSEESALKTMPEKREKIRVSHLIFQNSIDEMGLISLMNPEVFNRFKDRIQQVLKEVYPEYKEIPMKEFATASPGAGALTWIQQNSKQNISIEKVNGQHLIENGKYSLAYFDQCLVQIVGQTITGTLCSPNDENQKHFILDLKEYQLIVSQIYLETKYNPGYHFPQLLHGSNDKLNWIELHRFNDITNSVKINSGQPFRYFKLSRSDTRKPLISGWEMAGKVMKTNPQ